MSSLYNLWRYYIFNLSMTQYLFRKYIFNINQIGLKEEAWVLLVGVIVTCGDWFKLMSLDRNLYSFYHSLNWLCFYVSVHMEVLQLFKRDIVVQGCEWMLSKTMNANRLPLYSRQVENTICIKKKWNPGMERWLSMNSYIFDCEPSWAIFLARRRGARL